MLLFARPAEFRLDMQFGFAIMVLVFATADVSGGHLNPAVTVAFLVTQECSFVKAIVYIVCQCAGAILGALYLQGTQATFHVPRPYSCPLVMCRDAQHSRPRHTTRPTWAPMTSAISQSPKRFSVKFSPHSRWFSPSSQMPSIRRWPSSQENLSDCDTGLQSLPRTHVHVDSTCVRDGNELECLRHRPVCDATPIDALCAAALSTG